MNTFAQKRELPEHPQSVPSRSLENRDSPAPASLQETLNRSPAVRAQHQLQRAHDASPGVAALTKISATIQKQKNRTGLPDDLKAGIEGLSGLSLDDVRVHYGSPRPAQLQALAYASGTAIHVAPGQEQHLPHEAWHVVQQKQGRVQPTTQLHDVAINDDEGLEKEADVMGARALSQPAMSIAPPVGRRFSPGGVAQRAAPEPVNGEETAFLSLYEDRDTNVQFRKLNENEFLLNGKLIRWNGNEYVNSAGQAIDLAEANAAAEPDADVLDITQGEIGYLPGAEGPVKKIRSTNASPCVIVTIHDTESRKTMMAHVHRKNKIDDFLSKAVDAFGEDNQNLQVQLSTKDYQDLRHGAAKQQDERERQQAILNALKAKLPDRFSWIVDDEIPVDEANENVTIDAATGAITNPLDGEVDRDRGAMGVRRAMAIEQGWGQEAQDNSKDFAPPRSENIIPADEAVFQYKVAAGLASPASRGLSGGAVVQRRWTEAGQATLVWDKPRDGLRWFYDRTNGQMYFEVANEELAGNVEALLKEQGVRRTYDQWVKAGWLHEQDAELWKEAGWDVESDIEVSIMGQALRLKRGRIYLVGVDHREQGPFVDAMQALGNPDVAFVFEGYDSSRNQELPEQVYGLEGRYEKLAMEAAFAARFVQRFLKTHDLKAFTEFADMVVPYAKIAIDAVVTDELLSAKMAETSGKGIGSNIKNAISTQDQIEAGGNEDILKVLLAVAHASTALVAETIADEDERERLLDEHEFAANFNPKMFPRKAEQQDWLHKEPIQTLNELREAAMVRNVARASSPVNAVVVCVGALHAQPLLAQLGSKATGYEGDGEFFTANRNA